MTILSSKFNPYLFVALIYGMATFMFILVLVAIEQSNIWSFMSNTGTMLLIVVGPKDPAFYKIKLHTVTDLNTIEFLTDPISAAIFSVTFIMVVIGLIGGFLSGA